MDAEFWKARWQSNEIGFHEGSTNTMLAKHWPTLKLPAGSQVFVPLCGKSRRYGLACRARSSRPRR